MAKGGTLFLDEIGTVPAEIQTMLLRVLQENIYVPVGSNRELQADVRIVAATNEDMERAVRNGTFREDLFHRLAGFEIRQPLLSECPEDIIPLAEFSVRNIPENSGRLRQASRLRHANCYRHIHGPVMSVSYRTGYAGQCCWQSNR